MTAARIRPTVRGGDQVGITIPRVAELHNVTYPPAKNAIKTLVALGALREMARTFSYGAKGFYLRPCDAGPQPAVTRSLVPVAGLVPVGVATRN